MPKEMSVYRVLYVHQQSFKKGVQSFSRKFFRQDKILYITIDKTSKCTSEITYTISMWT